MLFKGALKDLMEEVQGESLSTLFQDKQVLARGMIHHQLQPPKALLDNLQDSTNETSSQDIIVENNIASKESEITMEDVLASKMLANEDQCLGKSRYEILQTMDACEDHQEIESENVAESICDLENHRDTQLLDASLLKEQGIECYVIQDNDILGEYSSLLQEV